MQNKNKGEGEGVRKWSNNNRILAAESRIRTNGMRHARANAKEAAAEVGNKAMTTAATRGRNEVEPQ
jgi:hypothetical protein